jgi:hypothetical protein
MQLTADKRFVTSGFVEKYLPPTPGISTDWWTATFDFTACHMPI